MAKYRFDDTYEKVYEYDEEARAYIFCGSYLAYGITPEMSQEKQLQLVEED